MTERVDVVERLAEIHRQGRLVPFVGAGMSYPALPLWPEFVDRLVADATAQPRRKIHDEHAAARATDAAHALRAEHRLGDAVRAALGKEAHARPIPRQTEALAKLRWPLVITTNYDHLFGRATLKDDRNQSRRSDAQEGLTTLGRSPSDCSRVLTSLRTLDRPLLWAVQGFLGADSVNSNRCACCDDPTLRRLEAELVVGHADYRRVVHAQPHFRRAFAEVVRSRSLLFLGSSLERYLSELLAEIVEFHGLPSQPHFAVLFGAEAERRERELASLGITCIGLSKTDDLPGFLEALNRAVAVLPSAHERAITIDGARLQIQASYIAPTRPNEWRVFSIGGTLKDRAVLDEQDDHDVLPSTRLGERAARLLGELAVVHRTTGGYHLGAGWERVDSSAPLPMWRRGSDIGIYARVEGLHAPQELCPTPDSADADADADDGSRPTRDLRVLALAVAQIMEAAGQAPVELVRMEMLATGSRRTFPATHAFVHMMRGWSRWGRRDRERSERKPTLSIQLDRSHPGDQEIIAELDSGRIRLDAAADDRSTQFTLEVFVDANEQMRRTVQCGALDPFHQVLSENFPLRDPPTDAWTLTVRPDPRRTNTTWSVGELARRGITVEALGVVPDSVVALRYSPTGSFNSAQH